MKTLSLGLLVLIAACAPSSEEGVDASEGALGGYDPGTPVRVGAYDSAKATLTVDDEGGVLTATLDLGATLDRDAPYLYGTIEIAGSRARFIDASRHKCHMNFAVTSESVEVTGACKGTPVHEVLVPRKPADLVGTYICNDSLLGDAAELTIEKASVDGLSIRIEALKPASKLTGADRSAAWAKRGVTARSTSYGFRFYNTTVVDWSPAVVVRDTFIGGRCIRRGR